MSKVVTKMEFVNAVADTTKLQKVQVSSVFDAMSSFLSKSLKSGNEVKFPFGKVKVVSVKAKKGINPFTKKPMTIPACKKPKFVFSKEFKLMFKK